jgi:hypothetical protein
MKTCNGFPILAALALAGAILFVPAPGSASSAPAAIVAGLLGRDGQMFTLSGVVQSVDYVSNIVVVRTRGDIETVRITPTTSVETGGQVGSIADLRPGVHVKIKGSIRDGELTAESIVAK